MTFFSSFLIPHSSFLIPYSSFLIPHSSLQLHHPLHHAEIGPAQPQQVRAGGQPPRALADFGRQAPGRAVQHQHPLAQQRGYFQRQGPRIGRARDAEAERARRGVGEGLQRQARRGAGSGSDARPTGLAFPNAPVAPLKWGCSVLFTQRARDAKPVGSAAQPRASPQRVSPELASFHRMPARMLMLRARIVVLNAKAIRLWNNTNWRIRSEVRTTSEVWAVMPIANEK